MNGRGVVRQKEQLMGQKKITCSFVAYIDKNDAYELPPGLMGSTPINFYEAVTGIMGMIEDVAYLTLTVDLGMSGINEYELILDTGPVQ